MLSTTFTQRFGLDHPIIQAGMGNDCGAELAAAVSNAGALGTIGSIGRTPDNLHDEIRRCRELTDRPFAVNVVTWKWAPFAQVLLDVAIEERVPSVTISFGDPIPALKACQQARIPAVVQVQDVAGLRAAIEARPDAIAVQGNEAGGHTGSRGTLSFAAQALDLAGDIPVLIAGGIADGRGLAAVLAMGGAGAIMGTRFKATNEFGLAAPHSAAQKQAIVGSDGSNTLWDEIFDEAYGMEWPNGIEGRALRSKFTEEWKGRSEELRQAVDAAGKPFGFVAQLAQSPETVVNWAGESSGLVRDVLPAAEVVERTARQAEELLQAAARTILGVRA
ncbi:MAG: nitronate monooxygenase [Dehalococcoidia bacterium]|nr:nitronate monooxygenase [Dehalococcoidia bacterium]